MKTIKRYWWFFVLILILFPALINAIHSQINEPSGWTSVWAEYGGAIISTLAAFFILYEQQKQNHDENEQNRKLQSDAIQQNHEENERNRKLQLNTIKYQQEYVRFTDFKSKLIKFYSDLSPIFILNVGEKMNFIYKIPFTKLTEKDKFKAEIENIRSEIRNKMDVLNIDRIYFVTFYSSFEKDAKEHEYYARIMNYLYLFQDILKELSWILITLPNYDTDWNNTKEKIKSLVKLREEDMKSYNIVYPGSDGIKITDIIKEYDYNFYENAPIIISKRINVHIYGKIQSIEILQNAMFDFIEHEQQKVNDILTKDIN